MRHNTPALRPLNKPTRHLDETTVAEIAAIVPEGCHVSHYGHPARRLVTVLPPTWDARRGAWDALTDAGARGIQSCSAGQLVCHLDDFAF